MVAMLKLHYLAGGVAEIPLVNVQRASVCEDVDSAMDMRRRDKRFKTEDEDLTFEHTEVATNESGASRVSVAATFRW